MSDVSTLLAQLPDVSAVQVLMVVNGALTVGLGAVYRDCRKERSLLWAHVRDLEKRVNRA